MFNNIKTHYEKAKRTVKKKRLEYQEAWVPMYLRYPKSEWTIRGIVDPKVLEPFYKEQKRLKKEKDTKESK